jgi:hypothetical protein
MVWYLPLALASKAMFPFVENLIKNGNLKVEMTQENIILLTLAATGYSLSRRKSNKTADDVIECPNCEGSGYAE